MVMPRSSLLPIPSNVQHVDALNCGMDGLILTLEFSVRSKKCSVRIPQHKMSRRHTGVREWNSPSSIISLWGCRSGCCRVQLWASALAMILNFDKSLLDFIRIFPTDLVVYAAINIVGWFIKISFLEGWSFVLFIYKNFYF